MVFNRKLPLSYQAMEPSLKMFLQSKAKMPTSEEMAVDIVAKEATYPTMTVGSAIALTLVTHTIMCETPSRHFLPCDHSRSGDMPSLQCLTLKNNQMKIPSSNVGETYLVEAR